MKVTFLGNSHLAAVKLGWDASIYRNEHEALFFGSSRDKMRALKVVDGVLQAGDEDLADAFRRTAGQAHIPADSDLYVLVGLQSSMTHAMGLFRHHRTLAARDPSGRQPLISRACLRAAIRDQIRFGLALRTVKALREVSGARAVLIADPFISGDVLTDDRLDYWRHEAVRLEVQAMHREAVEEFLKPEIAIQPQPADTVIDRCFTRPEYMKGAMRLGSAGYTATRTDKDRIHANADFGVAVLASLFESSIPGAMAAA